MSMFVQNDYEERKTQEKVKQAIAQTKAEMEKTHVPLSEVQKLVDRMRELGQAMPPNMISMNIQKALKEWDAKYGEKNG